MAEAAQLNCAAQQQRVTDTSNMGPLAGVDMAALKKKLKLAASVLMPAIFKRGTGEAEFLQEMGIQVPDWATLRQAHPQRTAPTGRTNRGRNPDRGNAAAMARGGHVGGPPGGAGGGTVSGLRRVGSSSGGGGVNGGGIATLLAAAPKMSRALKSKSNGSGRQYTSKFRGVHQTFPTKRWEAQFRRNGKPTSLGCFDHEEEAARAYDKMMLWCELHNAAGVKGGITNYDPSEYAQEIEYLTMVSQDELIDALRTNGRKQAAQRHMRNKRDHGTTSGSNKRGRASREATGTTTTATSDADGGGGGSAEVGTGATGGRRESSVGVAGSQMVREGSVAAAGASVAGLEGPGEGQSGLSAPPPNELPASSSHPPASAAHSGGEPQG